MENSESKKSASISPVSNRAVVKFRDVDIVFGSNPKSALPLIDEGKTRPEIQEATGQVLGVAGCTLDVHEGEIVVLMGLSGSGKSTLLRAVNGLNPVIRGEALVAMDDGASDKSHMINPQSCSRTDLRTLRQKRVAMVFQQFGLLPWRTVAENVGFGLELSGLDKSKRVAKVIEQLKLVGLDTWKNRKVHELSGGMQQRVGLARAFATEAPILLMDEPFSALDPLIRDKLQDELLDLQKKLQRTILFVSHDLDEALKIGNRIAIMEGGRIIQVGTAQEIIMNPATNYVAEFVAHMNPLSVLRAREVMSTQSVPKGAQTIAMGDQPLVSGTFASAPPETPLKEIMDAQLQTGLPVLITENGNVVGVVERDDVMRALLRKPQLG